MKIESNEDTRKYVNFINIINNIFRLFYEKSFMLMI